MSTPVIENLLQGTTSGHQVSSSTRPQSAVTDLFQEHLDRASDTATSLQKAGPDPLSKRTNSENFSKSDTKKDTSTEQHHEAPEGVQRTDKSKTQSSEPTEEHETQDEVTLSSEVTATSEAFKAIEDALIPIPTNLESVPESTDNNPDESEVAQRELILLNNKNPENSTDQTLPQQVETDENLTSQVSTTEEEASTDVSQQAGTAGEVVQKAVDPGGKLASGLRDAHSAPQSATAQQEDDEIQTEKAGLTHSGETLGSKKNDSNQELAQTPEASHHKPDGEPTAHTPDTPPTGSAGTNQPSTPPTLASGTETASGSQLVDQVNNSSPPSEQPSLATEADSQPSVDRTRFIQRVSGAFRAAQERDGQIHLRLSPPELGSLRIEIAIKQGVLTAQLETETATARNLILDNLPALRQRLAEQDISIEKFDVDVRDEGNSQNDQKEATNHESDHSPYQHPAASTQNPESQKQSYPTTTDVLPQTIPIDGTLDVMI